jgi:hypothetical protein
MPSGLLHIMLSREAVRKVKEDYIKTILSAGIFYLQLGSVMPDIRLNIYSRKSLDGLLHQTKTNQIPILILNHLKKQKGIMKQREFDKMFSFCIGYISHIVADAVFNPFIRDKVGGFEESNTRFRIYEMKLDVLFFNYFTSITRQNVSLVCKYLNDEFNSLMVSKEINMILLKYARSVFEVYNDRINCDDIKRFIEELILRFDISKTAFPFWYPDLIKNTHSFILNDIYENKYSLLELNDAFDLRKNFLKKNYINVIDDCITQFHIRFIELIHTSYDFIYGQKRKFSENELPSVNLYNGRPEESCYDLDIIPTYWR